MVNIAPEPKSDGKSDQVHEPWACSWSLKEWSPTHTPYAERELRWVMRIWKRIMLMVSCLHWSVQLQVPASLLSLPSSKSPASPMIPSSLPLPSPLLKTASPSTPPPLAPFSSSAPPLLTLLCCTDPHRIFRCQVYHRPHGSTGLPHLSGSAVVSRHFACTVDFRALSCASSLHLSGFTLVFGYTALALVLQSLLCSQVSLALWPLLHQLRLSLVPLVLPDNFLPWLLPPLTLPWAFILAVLWALTWLFVLLAPPAIIKGSCLRHVLPGSSCNLGSSNSASCSRAPTLPPLLDCYCNSTIVFT